MCMTADRSVTNKFLARHKENELVPIYKYVTTNTTRTSIKAPIKHYTYKPGLIEIDDNPKERRNYSFQRKGIHAFLSKKNAIEYSQDDGTRTWIRLYAVAGSLFGISKKGGHAVFGTVILKKSDYNDALARLRENAAYDKMYK